MEQVKKENVKIRTAKPEDAKQLLNIYAPYVLNTAITFEYEVPTIEEFQKRINRTLEKYPYIVAECNDEIVGYAYTGAFKPRAAYSWSVETTVYVRDDMERCGIGKALYRELERISALQHINNMNACIAYPEIEDEYLTKNSPKFHEQMGYTVVGEFHKCGYKFGRWYNMVWMEKLIGSHADTPEPFILFEVLGKRI